MHVSCEEFIRQVRDCPVGIVFARPGQPFVLQRAESAEDDTITGTWTAPHTSTMSGDEYLEFKAKLGAVLTEPPVYQRVAVFGEDRNQGQRPYQNPVWEWRTTRE